MSIDTELAAKLKLFRNEREMTQRDVATFLGLPHSAISDIENAKRDVTVSELKIFASLFSKSYEELLGDKHYNTHNIANVARLLCELPVDDIKELMFLIEYKRKRNEERLKKELESKQRQK